MNLKTVPTPHLRLPLAAVLALSTMAGTAKAVDVNGEIRRHDNNAARLTKLNPYMRPKIAGVLADLETHGYRPEIEAEVWRSPAEQARKVAQGYSQTLFSFHTATTRDGRPDSLAADIVDVRYGDTPHTPTPYWLTLAAVAESHRLTTGIYWGLSQIARKRIHAAIQGRNFNAKVATGWDTAHCEPVGITTAQARRGLRLYNTPKGVVLR